jgi:citrate lyase beta subunit
LKMELMVETPQALLALPDIFRAVRGRCRGAHFGAYDYLALIGIAGTHQSLLHAGCDFARSMMKVSLAGRGVFLSDGATNVLPIGDRASVQQAWRIHFGHVRHSLANGLYQGWDLHPAQLVSRYMAVYSFFRDGLDDAVKRLRRFHESSEQATLTGPIFDDAASALGLEKHLHRAINCGAILRDELNRPIETNPPFAKQS